MKTCEVCLHADKAIVHRFGIDICEACKKFYVRNRATAPDKLPCRNETAGTCQIDARIQRAPCPRCRLVKCFALGMGNFSKHKKYSGKLPSSACSSESPPSTSSKVTRVVSPSSNGQDHEHSGGSNDTSQPSSSTSTPPKCHVTPLIRRNIAVESDDQGTSKIDLKTEPSERALVSMATQRFSEIQSQVPPAPSCRLSAEAERYLRLIVESAAALSPLQSIKVDDSFLDSGHLDVNHEEALVWASGMRAFEWSIPFLLNCFQSLPDFGRLAQDVQWFCVNRSLSSLCLAQITLHFRSNPGFTPFYAFSPRLRDRWLAHFPCYKDVNQGILSFTGFLNTFNLSFAEFAFICALLVYRDDFEFESRNTQLRAVRATVYDCLQIYLRNIYGNNEAAIYSAMVRIQEAVRILEAIQVETFSAIIQVATAKPHLQMNSRQWASIYEEKIISPRASPRDDDECFDEKPTSAAVTKQLNGKEVGDIKVSPKSH